VSSRPALGVGVVGLGEIGQFHLRGYARAAPECEIRAVTDLDAGLVAAAAGAYGAAGHSSLDGLLADPAVDVVSVCLPHHLHHEVILRSVAAGKHVLCEKPLCLTVAECDDVIEAAVAAGVTLGVQHNQLFYPAHVRARELIESGEIGRPVLARLRLAIGGKFPGWRSRPGEAGGGILFDAGVHRFYVARFLLGEVAEVAAMGDRGPGDGEDAAVVTMRFQSGALGVIEANYHAPPGSFDDSVEVCGSAAALHISGCEAEFEGYRTGPALLRYDGSWRYEKVSQGNWADSVADSIGAYVRAVYRGEAAPVPATEGRRIIELIRQVYDVMGVGAA
jgi:predicted dehydrogenase